MKLTILKRGKDVDEDMATDIDFVSLLKARDIHYVSLAVPGLTVVSQCVEFGGGFDVRQRNDFMLRVNHAKETGTLYPQANITLLPSPTASYGGMDQNVHHEGEYSEAQVVAQILDAFKANSQYIKSRTIYFDFRNLGVRESHYLASLKLAIQRTPVEALPEEVITWEARE
jgi:hypothetical protein